MLRKMPDTIWCDRSVHCKSSNKYPLLNDLEYCPSELDNIPDLLQAIGNDVKISSYVQSILSHFPLVISKDVLASRNGDTDSSCWEQVHSLVWPSCRWKLPPLNSPKGGLGWRTEIDAWKCNSL